MKRVSPLKRVRPMKRVKPGNPGYRTRKRVGELSEAAFVLKAATLGFLVAKPWGDSERYDFILDNGERLWRVQLKCTEVINAHAYAVRPTHLLPGKIIAVYTAKEIDVLVVHIVPVDVWYILPVEAFTKSRHFRFYPDLPCKRKPRWEKYREAWHLLAPRPRTV
jgi:hypothetical protein